MVATVLFIAVIVLGIITSAYAFRVRRDAISEISEVLKLKSYGIIVLSVGYILHTLGDFISPYYGEGMALILESIAHGIILVAFVIFYKTARQAIISSREYWFK